MVLNIKQSLYIKKPSHIIKYWYVTACSMYLLFCWHDDTDVMKCAFKRSAVAFPSVIRRWLRSLLKKAFAPPVSVTASTWIGKLGMFIENALKKNHIKIVTLRKHILSKWKETNQPIPRGTVLPQPVSLRNIFPFP